MDRSCWSIASKTGNIVHIEAIETYKTYKTLAFKGTTTKLSQHCLDPRLWAEHNSEIVSSVETEDGDLKAKS